LPRQATLGHSWPKTFSDKVVQSSDRVGAIADDASGRKPSS
jgi:hypothetical protein